MQHKKILLSVVKKLFTPILVGLFFTGFISCNNEKKDGDKAGTATAMAASTFQMNCVRLDRSQVQSWVDSGWTNPKTPDMLIKKLLFQFYTGDAANAATNMQLMSYPGNTYTDVYTTGKVFLQIDTTCTGLTLTGPVSLSNNYINFATLGITDANGNLTDFEFIRFRPVLKFLPYISFAVEVVQKTAQGEKLMDGGGTYPCPTICP